MDLKPLRAVLRLKRRHRIGGQWRRRGYLGQRPTIRPSEVERAIRPALHLVALLVNRAVMATAQ
jgi:hypothetical protein